MKNRNHIALALALVALAVTATPVPAVNREFSIRVRPVAEELPVGGSLPC